MPQSKKDLRAQKQRANVKAGIGDEKGRVASNQKVNSNTFYTKSDYSMGCWLTYCFRTSFKLRFFTIIYSSDCLFQDAPVMASCTICKQSIRMIKANTQAKAHVESKHSGKKFDVSVTSGNSTKPQYNNFPNSFPSTHIYCRKLECPLARGKKVRLEFSLTNQ